MLALACQAAPPVARFFPLARLGGLGGGGGSTLATIAGGLGACSQTVIAWAGAPPAYGAGSADSRKSKMHAAPARPRCPRGRPAAANASFEFMVFSPIFACGHDLTLKKIRLGTY
jgi:hypothetical protein